MGNQSNVAIYLVAAFETVEEEVSIHPDWFLEVPEELDVCVAQRHFEEALTLLQKAKEYILQHKDSQSDHVLADIERKVNVCLIKQYTFVLACRII